MNFAQLTLTSKAISLLTQKISQTQILHLGES